MKSSIGFSSLALVSRKLRAFQQHLELLFSFQCLVICAFAQAAPFDSLNIDNISFKDSDFMSQFDSINRELNKMATANSQAFARLTGHLAATSKQVHDQLKKINYDLNDKIWKSQNPNLTPAQIFKLMTELLAAYQKTTEAIDKEITDQTKAANDTFDKIKIKETANNLIDVIAKAVEAQKTAATDLAQLPQKLRANINTHFKVISEAAKNILSQIGRR